MTDQGFDEQCSNDDRCRCPECREQQAEAEEALDAIDLCESQLRDEVGCGFGIDGADCYSCEIAKRGAVKS